jgi:hypothetical protein
MVEPTHNLVPPNISGLFGAGATQGIDRGLGCENCEETM